MVEETILQHWIFSQFALPFLLIFFIVFGVLEKSKVFGDGSKQLNALLAFVVGLIFVAVIDFNQVVSNLILFLAVSLVVMFVGLLLWGFVAGDKGLQWENVKGFSWVIIMLISIALIAGVLWAAGTSIQFFYDIFSFLFTSDWSQTFWTNVVFIAAVIGALAFVLTKGNN
ncbi:MAG: hypothetical protein WDZ62_01065 [Candidatus Pacearchaeota archaeon]